MGYEGCSFKALASRRIEISRSSKDFGMLMVITLVVLGFPAAGQHLAFDGYLATTSILILIGTASAFRIAIVRQVRVRSGHVYRCRVSSVQRWRSCRSDFSFRAFASMGWRMVKYGEQRASSDMSHQYIRATTTRGDHVNTFVPRTGWDRIYELSELMFQAGCQQLCIANSVPVAATGSGATGSSRVR